MGTKAFQVLQLGREAIPGTNVAATTKWRGPGAAFRDARKMVFPNEDIGIVGGTDRSYTPSLLAEFDTAETEMTFEQTPHVMEACFGTATPGADGAGSGKIYDYVLPDTAELAYTSLKTYSAEFGDSTQYDEASFCVCSEWELKGKTEEAWKFASKWFGQQSDNATKTAGVAIPVVNDALFQKTKLYIDAVSGSYGTTLAGTMLEANVKCVTGWYPLFAGNGNLYFKQPAFDSEKYMITVDITFLMETAAITQRDLWKSETPRLITLKTEGSALTSAGTTYTYRTILQNYAGKWQSFEAMNSQNGTSIIKASFLNRYNATKADRGNITFVNELAALP